MSAAVGTNHKTLDTSTPAHGKVPVLLASRNHHIDGDDDETTAKEQSQTPYHSHPVVSPEVRALDIIKYLIGTIAGKDKIAKTLKSVLDIVRKLTVVFPLLRTRIGNGRLLATISSQLALFRSIMRFGTSPSAITALLAHLGSAKQIRKNPAALFNQSLLSDSIDVYSTVFDELSLLNKLGLVRSKQFRKTIAKHDTWATEVDAIHSFKSACVKYRQLRKQRSTADAKAVLMNKIDVARFTLELVSSSTDLLTIRSPGIQSIVSLFASVCSATSGVVNLWRLWILAADHLAKTA